MYLHPLFIIMIITKQNNKLINFICSFLVQLLLVFYWRMSKQIFFKVDSSHYLSLFLFKSSRKSKKWLEDGFKWSHWFSSQQLFCIPHKSKRISYVQNSSYWAYRFFLKVKMDDTHTCTHLTNFFPLLCLNLCACLYIVHSARFC